MIEHVTIHVEDLDEARDFWEALLAPLGYEVTRRLPDHDDSPRVAFGRDRRAQLWLVEESMAHEGLTIALSADDADAVEAFRAAADAAGAEDVRDVEDGEDGRTVASAKDASGNRIVAVVGGSGRGMIDHVQMVVSDFGRTLRFYEKLLEPLGVATTARDLDNPEGARVGFGQGGETSLWLTEEGDPQSSVAIGFSASAKKQVDEFHTNAVDFGARNIAKAAARADVGPDYYVSGATDPDNNRIEAVHDGEHGLAPAAAVDDSEVDKLAEAAALQRWEAERAQAKAAAMAEADKRAGRGTMALSSTPLAMTPKSKAAAKKADDKDEDDAETEDAGTEGAEGEDDLDLAALGLGGDDDEEVDLSALGLDDDDAAETPVAASEDDDEIDWAALGLGDDEETTETMAVASADDEEIDWAALGLGDDDETSETPSAAADDDEEIDWAALGLGDDDEETPSASESAEEDEEIDLSALGLDDDEAEEEKPKAKPEKKKPISKSAMGLDF